ncbi:CBS domain-containing protein [Nocardiopsis sp. RV163]|uniref:CBS domain-containing protein n=1 Tax=Nocardiopsis sp. RV163 TaxID=1661388 RepID=UPI00064BB4CB|nr:CBS domain-containing protein [Nocardiopsis sp. RV163]
MIRSGRHGEREDLCLREGVIIVGWHIGDINECRTREELKRRVRAAYPDAAKGSVANWTGQLWRFARLVLEGDHVVMPLKNSSKSSQKVAIGRVVGHYEYDDRAPEGFRHIRRVEWLRKDVPRTAIQQDLLDSMGSLLTVCGLTRFDAARRVAVLAGGGKDPGAPTVSEKEEWHEAEGHAELLAQAVARDPHNPITMTIRKFLSYWNVARRTPSSEAAIQSDLEEKGLTTQPSFTEGWIDNTIAIVRVGEEPTGEEATSTPLPENEVEEPPEPTSATLRVGDLEAANRKVVSVKPQDTVRKAVTTMISRNFSQLAVISDDGLCHGVVSWESIGKMRLGGLEPTSVDQVKANVPIVEQDDLLLDQIPHIYGHGFVLVRSSDLKSVSGIVTAADLTLQFGELARPFVLIEEAERRLRQCVDDVFSAEDICAATNKKPDKVKSAADLTLGSYWHLLKGDDEWSRLGWDVDHEEFLDLLKTVTAIRNETMHFSPDPLTEEQIDKLNGFIGLLRVLNPDG